jgi:hypothetical protein
MKFFATLLLFPFFALTVSGQDNFIGIKGGYSLTNIATNAFAIHETQPGFSFGLTYDFVTKKNLLFGAEFLYEKRGYTNELIFTDNQGNPTGEKYSIPIHYIYFALPIKFGYSVGKKFFGFASIGVCPALLQKATVTYPTFNYPEGTYKGDTTYFFSNPSEFDISGLAEIGCGYSITNRFTIATSFRYQYSFTSLTDENYFKNYYINNYGMTLRLGIKFNLTYKSQTKTAPTTQ